MPAIGFDIGGTSSRAGVVDRAARVTDFSKVPTPPTLNELVDWIAGTFRRWACEDQSIAAAGVALPGVVELSSGTCVRCVNLPWLEGQPVADLLERKIERRPLVMTDAQAATWAEFIAAGKPQKPFAHLRLGTGVACCVVVNGRFVGTEPARRTHWPWLVVDASPAAPNCPCGLRGCLELFAGGKALTQQAQQRGLRHLGELAIQYQSNEVASLLIDRAAAQTARAIFNLQNHFAVQVVALGGGVIDALTMLPALIEERCNAIGVRVRKASLGDEAGVIGAAQMAREANLSAESPIN